MSGSQASEEKTLPPSPRKLKEARRKGQVARSRDLVTAAVTVTALGFVFARAGVTFDRFEDALNAAGQATDQPFAASAGVLAGTTLTDIFSVVIPLAGLLVAAAAITAIVANGGVVASVDPILPKLERLDPANGFKRLFGMKNLVELVKAIVKLVVVGTVALLLIAAALQALVEQPACGLACAGPLLRGLLRPLLGAACLIFLVVGALDIGVQRWLFRRDMRMTKTELKRERKEMEGDPLIKRQHRRDRRAALQAAVRTGLRNATFIIRSNETALAFRYARPDATVPVLVARGGGDGMALMLDEARAARLPVVVDSAAAGVLLTLKVGQMVGKSQFQPVIGCMRQAGLL